MMPEKRVGGRPALYYEILRRFIPKAIQQLGRARPIDLKKLYEKELRRSICYDTIQRYCEIFVAEGLLQREVEISNKERVAQNTRRRQWNMVWYKLQ